MQSANRKYRQLQFAKKGSVNRTADFSEIEEFPAYFLPLQTAQCLQRKRHRTVENRSQKNNQILSKGKFLLFRLHRNIMKARKIISDRVIPAAEVDSNPPGRDIPIHFPTDSSCAFQIKMQPNMLMNPTFQAMTGEKPLIPGLFQLAACAGSPGSMSVPQNANALGQTPFAEMMLNPKKLEAILKTIARLEKPVTRRIAGRLAKISRARTARTR
ncbi:MAG TPA: hypothetical protein VNU95_08135 [Candidatus Acidoferrales bacterium]|jgi:hypothetical protein|nr:hypothetical protein [Candidatus Acidoferrales bacterium]